MQERLHDVLKKVYRKEIARNKVPPLPVEWQAAGRKSSARKQHRYSWLQAAVVFVILCIFAVTIFSATGNQQGELAELFADVNKEFEIGQHISDGIEKLQLIFCFAFKNCS